MTRFRPSMTWFAITALSLAVAITGCRRQAEFRQTGGGEESTGTSGHQGIKFNVTIDFTGLKPIQGSFVDDDHAGVGSCRAFANENLPIVGWQGPQPPAGRLTTVGGQRLDFGLGVAHDKYHGPGTYAEKNAVFGVTVGGEVFSGGGEASSVTVNPDGSGSATFSDLHGLKTYGRESGTIHWTCSGM